MYGVVTNNDTPLLYQNKQNQSYQFCKNVLILYDYLFSKTYGFILLAFLYLWLNPG